MTEHSHPVGCGCSAGCPAHGLPPTPPPPPPAGTGSPSREAPPHLAEIDVTRRLDQIEQTALRVRPTDVGKWAMATGKPSAASAVVIAPADLYWLLAMVRATRIASPAGGRP